MAKELTPLEHLSNLADQLHEYVAEHDRHTINWDYRVNVDRPVQ